MRIDPQKLRRLRGERKQTEVADALGISQPRLSNWERGAKRIPSDMLARLLIYYRASIEDVLTV